MNIGVVIVTYNRIDQLKKALSLYVKQKYRPKYIIVVNNNSTDGTSEFLNKWSNENDQIKKYIINLTDNIGGSGGFYTGLKKASELDADWIWVADDDAYPENDALWNSINYIKHNNIKNDISAICGKVINNGKIDLSHRKRVSTNLLNVRQEEVSISEYEKNSFNLNLFSYVGTLINKEHLIKAGLTEKDYFIYYDDTEHSYRLSKIGKIICIPSIKIVHDIADRTANDVDWKGYYTIRNRMLFYKKHFKKRYYIYNYLTLLIKCSIKNVLGKDKVKNNQIRIALKDSKNDKKGIHELYKPGWKSS